MLGLAIVLAGCGVETDPDADIALPDVSGATLLEFSVLEEVGQPFDPDYTIDVYEVIGTTFTGRAAEGDSDPVELESMELTPEQVAEFSELFQASELVNYVETEEGDCVREERVVVSALWDNDVFFSGAMPGPVFSDPDTCVGGWTATGDVTGLLVELRMLSGRS